ncbi:MAG: hypothetical protein KatS3mg104_1799 [Phycisphaerae bacterium]|jgi:antirestriction protein ArdC|nr:MAG: hypothetical protein KatS3mg104_1799 [Phycisphaerae bacterium]
MRASTPEASASRPSSRIDWQHLLTEAVTKPGVIAAAYSMFWNYSLCNMMLAHLQCLVRGIEPGPLHTFKGWLKVGRHVRRGEKALKLVMPVTVRTKGSGPPIASRPNGHDADGDDSRRTIFVERPFWFTLSQTDGEPYTPVVIPDWDETQALSQLDITRVPFRHLDGNCQGYAHQRNVSVSLIAFLPHRTLLHEVAHVILGHTAESTGELSDTDTPTPRDLREVEAESVAMLCCSSLGLGGQEFSRGYIQHWTKSEQIPDRSIQRIFKAADAILKAGRPPAPTPESDSPPA